MKRRFYMFHLFCAIFLLIMTSVGSYSLAGEVAGAGSKVLHNNIYRIGPEDELEILVWKNPNLSRKVTVRPDGMISLPLIGDVPASGYTTSQLRDIIAVKLQKYQQSVDVTVMVTAINSYKVFIFGEVAKPGMYKLHRKTSLIQAIALAGGFSQFASRNNIILVREEGTGSKRITVRFDDIVYKNKYADKNLILKPGDTIFVP